MIDFNNHQAVLKVLGQAQDADRDMREATREAHHFIDKRDGQWEPDVLKFFNGKPRYTMDKCNNVVDSVAGEMEGAAFNIKVRPSSGDASIETAKVYDGIIRNIRNISNADHVFNQAGRSMITGGLDGWEIVQDYVDADTFDQDLFIRKIPNFIDRVWFDTGSEEQDRSDARWCVVLQVLTRDEYEDKFPDGSGQSIGDERAIEVYENKPDFITVGKLLYKKPIDIELVRMSNGHVYEDNEEFKSVADELLMEGITETDRRTRKSHRVYSRIFDGADFLIEPEETVFDFLPVIPTYGNFKISENKVIWRGIIEKLMDAQRVHNYAWSKKVQSVALSPVGKYWATKEQVAGHTKTLATLNTNPNPVQTYNHVDGTPAPFWQGGAQIDAGLQEVELSSSNAISESAGLFAANMGDNPGLQSGVAIGRQVDKGDTSTIKWFSSQEVAICHTAKILVNAIPRVYDSTRTVRLLAEDGTSTMSDINKAVLDDETGQSVELNNLASGEYDVVCDVGPAFKNRQQEATQALLELIQADPTLMQTAGDILVKNQDAPNMDLVHERMRAERLQAGVIPESQYTEEERVQIQQAQAEAQNQPPQEDPNMVLARAEEGKAQADMMNAQTKQQVETINAQNKQAELQLEAAKLQLQQQQFDREANTKFNVDAAKIQQDERKIDMQEQQMQVNAMMQRQKFEMEQQKQEMLAMMEVSKQQQQQLNDAVNNLKVLREAMGVDAVVGEGNMKAYAKQADIVSSEQADIE